MKVIEVKKCPKTVTGTHMFLDHYIREGTYYILPTCKWCGLIDDREYIPSKEKGKK